MHKIVHLFFASRIRKQIRAHTGISLHAFRFAYGNIKPDLTFSMCFTPHTFACSEAVLHAHIGELFEESLHIADFSEKLGIVMHYLCDYFCFAHTELFSSGLLAHAVYELRMIRSILLLPAYNARSAKPLPLKTGNHCNAKILSAYLQTQYSLYLSNCPSAFADLVKAMEASEVFCLDAVERWCSLCFEPTEEEYWEDVQSAISTVY